MSTPTEQAYSELQHAYDVFNTRLFAGQLLPCLITMQRKNRTYGYFSGERWNDRAGAVTDEIALNPVHFATRSTEAVLSTLVHEMVHLWQHHCGKPPRKGYHDKQWAAKMHEVGLLPSATGEEGGKETGQKMTHLIEENGRFAQAVQKLLAEHPAILYYDQASDTDTARKKKAASKTKYTCPDCGLNAWAKPDAPLVCGNCQKPMQPENIE